MDTPASEVVQQASKMPTIVAIFGNGVSYLVDHDKELQAISLTLTILWVLWQWGRSIVQETREQSTNRKLLAKLGLIRTQPIPLDTDQDANWQDHHQGK